MRTEYKSIDEEYSEQIPTRYECQECFALVFNREKHAEWHSSQPRNSHRSQGTS